MIAVLIVLYNKELHKSDTLNALINCYDKNKVALYIVNNGPNSMVSHPLLEKMKGEFYSLSFFEFLNNKPLSIIYNDFIKSYNDVGYFVIFDDDSVIHKDFFMKIAGSESDLILPIIQSRESGDIYYPKINGGVVRNEGPLNIKGLISISSGLAISDKLTHLVRDKYGEVFDESFALYGIDTSFFYRLGSFARTKSLSVICMSVIEHSLSRVDSAVSPFRTKERLYDAAITARRYPSLSIYYHLFKQVVKLIVLFKISIVVDVLKCFVKGKHPRC